MQELALDFIEHLRFDGGGGGKRVGVGAQHRGWL